MDFKVCTKCNINKPLKDFYTKKAYDKNNNLKIKYFAECKECIKERATNWNQNNPNKKKEISRKFDKSKKRKEIIKKRKDSIKAYQRKWQKKNPEYMRNYSQKRRNELNNLISDFTEEEWLFCKKFFNNSCAYCGEKESEENTLHQEHFIPLSKNGGYTKLNILPACKHCNSSKRDNDFDYWYKQQPFYSKKNIDKINNYFASIILNYDEELSQGGVLHG